MGVSEGYKMSKKEQILFNESIGFIREFYDIKNHLLPDVFLNSWIIPTKEDYFTPLYRFQNFVLTFAYMTNRLKNNDRVEWGNEVKLGIEEEELAHATTYFQTLLHLEQMRRMHIIDFEPIYLFHFENYDIIETINVRLGKDQKDNYESYMRNWLNDSSWIFNPHEVILQ